MSECIVCYEIINDDKIIFENCPHGEYVHEKCIMKWKNTCPLCRRVINNIIYINKNMIISGIIDYMDNNNFSDYINNNINNNINIITEKIINNINIKNLNNNNFINNTINNYMNNYINLLQY